MEVYYGPTFIEKSRSYAIGVPLPLLLKIRTDQAPETKLAFKMGLEQSE